MTVVEIAAGWFYNSMALLADGLHMSSHAVAIGLSALYGLLSGIVVARAWRLLKLQ